MYTKQHCDDGNKLNKRTKIRFFWFVEYELSFSWGAGCNIPQIAWLTYLFPRQYVGAAVGAGVVIAGAPVVVGAMGFGSTIAAGSYAAGMMSAAATANGGAVAAGRIIMDVRIIMDAIISY